MVNLKPTEKEIYKWNDELSKIRQEIKKLQDKESIIINNLSYSIKMHENKSELDLSTRLRNRAVEIAISKTGIKELTGKNDGPAIEEIQENIRWLIDQKAAWCASFVSYCFAMAAKDIGIKRPFEHIPGVYTLTQLAKKQGWYFDAGTKPPQRGDVFVMSNDHTGFVQDVIGSSIKTIEGNYQNQVGSRPLPIVGQITGYIRVVI